MKNIAEILKDCPKGTKLYSTIFGEVELEKTSYITIVVKDISGRLSDFYVDGKYHSNGECCLFPSKENRDWSKFHRPFEDGDILTYTGNYTTTFIYRNKDNEPNLSTSFYVGCNDAPTHNFLVYNKYTLIALNENCDVRSATEEEKERLFKAIKDNGYRWNSETKTLEKLIEPKFKVGDRIRHKTHIRRGNTVTEIKDTHYTLDDELALPFTSQDEYELIPNKFDISTLKPFDKVLVRDTNGQVWTTDLFSHIIDKNPNLTKTFVCNGHYASQCIPYNCNEHLLGTANNCDEYYKNW